MQHSLILSSQKVEYMYLHNILVKNTGLSGFYDTHGQKNTLKHLNLHLIVVNIGQHDSLWMIIFIFLM